MYKTIYEAFLSGSEAVPENDFLCVPSGRPHAPDGIRLTYAEARAQIDALVAAYRAGGYATGHRVALLLDSQPLHFLHFLALNALGASQVPMNPDHRTHEFQYQIEHSGADLVVCLESHAHILREAAAATAKRPPVVTVEAWPDALPPAPAGESAGVPGLKHEAALLYTSGTTALPKGCILTNEHFLHFGQWYVDFREDPESYFKIEMGAERMLTALPVYHVAGGALPLMTMLLARGTLILPGRFSASRWWRDVAETRATMLHYIGLIPNALIKQAHAPDERAHCVKWAIGAGMEPSLHAAFEERFGFPTIEVWGMTEIARFTAADREPRHLGHHAVGKPIRDLEVRLIGDDGTDVPAGTPGRLLVRAAGPDPRHGFFGGYLNDPDATEAAWRDGWFHTGDICRQDDDGMLYFVDRQKNIIRRSGENISAGEIEAVLLTDPDALQAAVISVADDLRQEEVYACVVAGDGAKAGRELADRLFDLCMRNLAYYKAPAWIYFLDSLPMTSTQKIQKDKIFSKADDPRAASGVFDYRALKKPIR